jgi:DNA-binding CsgD family transcriptional regulator/transcriptional regulator with XRE-family HTH domain
VTGDAGEFGDCLRAYRVSARLPQEELAGRSGVSVRAIGDMERGRTRWPHRDSVHRLADALRLTGQEREGFLALARRPVADPALAVAGPSRATEAEPQRALPRELPPAVPGFTGRSAELGALTGLLDRPGGQEPMLYGRGEQLAVIDRLLEGMRSGRAGSLVLRGEAGIGKTALLDAAEERAAGAMVLRVTGVESEAELPFAGLHALLRPVLGEVGVLPERQAVALRGALGMAEAVVADRFLVGLGVLSLVAELAEGRPVLCLVDDAQWVDRASADALVFAARRLHAERAAVLAAARDEPRGGGLPGLPELRVGGLDRVSAGRLLAGEGLALAVRDQLIADAAGNPLALMELSRGLSAAQRAGSVSPLPLPGASPADRVQGAFLGRVTALPEATRRAVLVAALGGTAGLAEVGRAIAGVGGSLTDLAAAERAGLVRVEPAGVAFSHPLARAAVLAGSDVAERAAAHRALAGVLDGSRRAWHLAALADGPDEQVAAELDAAARNAGARGSAAATSAAYERAAGLSADPAAKGRRLILAADAAFAAGQLPRAADLADQASQLAADPVQAATLARMRAVLQFDAGRCADAAGFMLDGAALLCDAQPDAAQAMVIAAVGFLWLDGGCERPDLERRAAAMLPPAEAGLVEFLQGVRRLQDGDTRAPVAVPARPGCRSNPFFDFIGGDLLAIRRAAAGGAAWCRDAGAVGLLTVTLVYLATAQGLAGEFLDAMATVEEGLRIAADTGQTAMTGQLASMAALLAAITGDEEACRARAAQLRDLPASAQAMALARADLAFALLDLGSGRYQAALDRLQAVTAGPGRHLPQLLYAYPDHVEAAIRCGRSDLAALPLAQFTAWAGAIGQPWAAAVAARCAALAADGADAGPLYRRAIAAHEGDGRPFEQARTRLLYGEWLRRSQRRADAREQLLAAAAAFTQMGAARWRERAGAELRAAGAVPPAVTPGDPLARLTPQELQVVRLAAAGASNKQIGAQLFLSPRTVGYHLYKAFPKLGVTAREELARYAP